MQPILLQDSAQQFIKKEELNAALKPKCKLEAMEPTSLYNIR